MDTQNKSLLIALSLLIAACSSPKYTSVQEKDSANISFTSLSDNFPDLELNLRGKTYSISRDMIDIAKSDSSGKKVFDIPANEKIILMYEVSEITDTSLVPVIKDSVKSDLGVQIDFEQQYKINLCTTDFTFTTDKNKNYEAIVEQSDGIICRVYVREVISSRGDKHDTYKQVKSSKPTS